MGGLVYISRLYDKDIFAKQKANIRSLPSVVVGKIIRTASKGDRIGKVYSHVDGYGKDYNDKDGSMWLELYPVKGTNSGKPTYFKFTSGVLDYDKLKEQGVKTLEEEKAEAEEKNKNWLDKLKDSVGKILPWVGIFYLAGKAIDKK